MFLPGRSSPHESFTCSHVKRERAALPSTGQAQEQPLRNTLDSSNNCSQIKALQPLAGGARDRYFKGGFLLLLRFVWLCFLARAQHVRAGEHSRVAALGSAAARPRPSRGLFPGFVRRLAASCRLDLMVSEVFSNPRDSMAQPPPQPRAERLVHPPATLHGEVLRPAQGARPSRYLLPVPGLGCAQAAEGQQDTPGAARLLAGHGAESPRPRRSPRAGAAFCSRRAQPELPPPPGSAPRCLWPPPPPRPRPRAAPSWPRCPLGFGPSSLFAAPRPLLTACTGGGRRAPHLRLSAPGRACSRPLPGALPAGASSRRAPGSILRPSLSSSAWAAEPDLRPWQRLPLCPAPPAPDTTCPRSAALLRAARASVPAGPVAAERGTAPPAPAARAGVLRGTALSPRGCGAGDRRGGALTAPLRSRAALIEIGGKHLRSHSRDSGDRINATTQSHGLSVTYGHQGVTSAALAGVSTDQPELNSPPRNKFKSSTGVESHSHPKNTHLAQG